MQKINNDMLKAFSLPRIWIPNLLTFSLDSNFRPHTQIFATILQRKKVSGKDEKLYKAIKKGNVFSMNIDLKKDFPL